MSLAQHHWNTRERAKVADPYWTPCDPEPISDNSCDSESAFIHVGLQTENLAPIRRGFFLVCASGERTRAAKWRCARLSRKPRTGGGEDRVRTPPHRPPPFSITIIFVR